MTKLQMRVMVSAARIRMKRGESLDDILAGWPNLTDDDRQYIREAVSA